RLDESRMLSAVADTRAAVLVVGRLLARLTSFWLEYSGEGSRPVYERVGFRPGGTRLYVSLEG
ncbi:hypothetical protein ACWD4N_46545, partial [Streptomyces sp. NPDC002586]